MKSSYSTAKRNLYIIASISLFLAIAILIFSVKQFVLGLPTIPSRQVLSIAFFVILPLIACCFTAIAICIWLELKRLKKAETDSKKKGVDPAY
ncbi:MAG TPA: hypothetical protein VFV23_07390 [Verrucomicrobiae bacterium]|nr:hypothetical protein [Verrucomicrobiae bacterium]